jgi:hypothetical protein
MNDRIQIVAIIATTGLFVVVFELVRQRRLMERYALLWLLSAGILLCLAIWRNLLERISGLIGVAYAPSALFVIAFGFILVLLLHFSLVISRLADQNKVLAQRIGLLQQHVDALRAPGQPPRVIEAQPAAEQEEYASARASGRRS